jgi:hypothetical protein
LLHADKRVPCVLCQILTNPLFFISLDEKGTIMLINIQTDISQNRQEPTNYQG